MSSFGGRPPQGLPFLNSLWLGSVHAFLCVSMHLLHLFHWTQRQTQRQSFTCGDHGYLHNSILLFFPKTHSTLPLPPSPCGLCLTKAVAFYTDDEWAASCSCLHFGMHQYSYWYRVSGWYHMPVLINVVLIRETDTTCAAALRRAELEDSNLLETYTLVL